MNETNLTNTHYPQKGLGSNVLKCIAMAAMFCDHFSVVFFGDGMTALRWIGRLAFPIYCFFVAVGSTRTSSIPRYLRRLLVFALISEIPFDLAFWGKPLELAHQNVFFTLFGGLFSIWCLRLLKEKKPALTFLAVLPLGAACVLTEFFGTDYGAMGVLAIFVFYLVLQTKRRGLYILGLFAATFVIALDLPYIFTYSFEIFLRYPVNTYELGALAAVPLMLLYTGKRGLQVNKYLFYAFYPAHLLLLWAVHALFF